MTSSDTFSVVLSSSNGTNLRVDDSNAIDNKQRNEQMQAMNRKSDRCTYTGPLTSLVPPGVVTFRVVPVALATIFDTSLASAAAFPA